MPVGLERNANSCKTCIRGDDCCSISGLVVALLTPCSPSPLPFLPEPRSRAQGSGISICVVNATALRLHYCLELLGMRWDPALSCGLLTCSGYFGRSSSWQTESGQRWKMRRGGASCFDCDNDCRCRCRLPRTGRMWKDENNSTSRDYLPHPPSTPI